ncbi:ABC transporter ATP-binding protein [Opitutaceae bacterium TAV4]|uniref:ABC transporter ATP-binding protein n=1 Tax=Geminisphaera colitermitum TaxID=1148786 RepID=UPI0001964EB0|nr:ABC transporter ATP-binding protein [Geminisphaera colitermitum]RRJ96181.1 ABC transporter ATP-binding protein [Opitutaceae bacterium TAV4]RRK00319.1 ABC transporter ATP-binding protein [Opitutaceae bacterium TAV3]
MVAVIENKIQATEAAPAGVAGAAIEISGVGKVFPAFDGGRTVALHAADVSVRPGEFVSLVGPSGCGKSTLLRIVAGLERATSGSVRLGEREVTGPDTRVGFVFQDPNLFPWLSVRDNIGFGPSLRTGRRHLPEAVDDLIERVGLARFAHALPHHLSGGMAQRVALARALVNSPEVLLLDEPLGALDAFTRMAMQDELLGLVKQRGATVLLVTHDIDEALYLSDRILVFSPRPGRIEHVFPVNWSHPRSRTAPDFTTLRSRVLELLHFAPSQVEDRDPSI